MAVRNWNNLEILTMIGSVVDIHQNTKLVAKDAFLRNIKLEDGTPEVIVYITEKGQGQKCFIKGGVLSVAGTGGTPNLKDEYLEEEIEFLQGER